MERFPCLETSAFLAFIADNAALGIHRAGYNGVASLIPKHSGNNLLVPTYAGLNYEHISLAGLAPYRHESGWPFEPRCEPMRIESADKELVVLVQPETSHSHVEARITFSVREPHYLHQCVELTPRRRFCSGREQNRLSTLWASYMHVPPDRHIYLKADWRTGGDLANWFGLTKASHGSPEWQIRPLPDDRDISAPEHLEAMQSREPLSQEELARLAEGGVGTEWLDGPLSFYYGLCHGSQMFLMMFRQPDRVRLAYSPWGGGQQPAWCPAWDYILQVEDAEPETTYAWDVCLALKPYAGRADVLAEVKRFLGP